MGGVTIKIMTTFVFMVNGAVHICRVKLSATEGMEHEDKAMELAERLGLDFGDCEWMAGKEVSVTTHYGVRKADEVDE